MVESARLESGCTLQWCTEGSNPSHSATDMTRPYALLRKDRIRHTPQWGPMMTSWWLAQTISLGYISRVYARKDSNPQPSEPKSDVLSVELRALGCYRISSLYKNGPAPCLCSVIALAKLLYFLYILVVSQKVCINSFPAYRSSPT